MDEQEFWRINDLDRRLRHIEVRVAELRLIYRFAAAIIAVLLPTAVVALINQIWGIG